MTKKSRIPFGYCNGQKAAQLVGVSQGTFYNNYVKNGRVQKFTPPGTSEGYFSIEEMIGLSLERSLFTVETSKAPKNFSRATEEDMRGIYELCVAAFGVEKTSTLEQRVAEWHACPDVYYVLKKEQIVIAYASLRHYTHDALMDMIMPRERLTVPGPHNLICFEDKKPIDHLFVSFAVLPGFTRVRKEQYALLLMRGTLRVLRDFADRGISVHWLYATSETEDGQRLANHLGMTETRYPGDNVRRYELNLLTSDALFSQHYRALLQRSPARQGHAPQRETAKRRIVVTPKTQSHYTATTDAQNGIAENVPLDAILLKDFAELHGVNRRTLLDHVRKYDLAHIALPDPARPRELKRYLTPEQQQAVLDFWTQNGTPHH